MSRAEPDRVPAAAARALLLRGQGLLDDPARAATPASVARAVRALGYVQVDSINRIERAHHLILASRLDGYAHRHLTTMAARRGGKLNTVEIREIIDGRKQVESHGSRDMPVWGSEFARARKKGEGREAAARNRVRALAAYLESIQALKR